MPHPSVTLITTRYDIWTGGMNDWKTPLSRIRPYWPADSSEVSCHGGRTQKKRITVTRDTCHLEDAQIPRLFLCVSLVGACFCGGRKVGDDDASMKTIHSPLTTIHSSSRRQQTADRIFHSLSPIRRQRPRTRLPDHVQLTLAADYLILRTTVLALELQRDPCLSHFTRVWYTNSP